MVKLCYPQTSIPDGHGHHGERVALSWVDVVLDDHAREDEESLIRMVDDVPL